MNLIVYRNGQVPNFALLLGAGASATSGVKTAEDMIQEWRQELYRQYHGEKEFTAWLSDQSWHGTDDEYSYLFEEVYDQPAQRRVYVEECVIDARASLGYIYLAELLANHLFDVVFTTNFDDLLNETCYLYSQRLRPIVAAHDSAIQGIRITAGRPKIIKIHGDFLYDTIKNTVSETEQLDENTNSKLGQFAKEFGLVVVGYSGRDRSVMDNIETLLRHRENFPHGVYWCIRNGATISNRLQSLLRNERVYPVYIDGFDEFSAELHATAGLKPPMAITDPLEMAKERIRDCFRFLNTEGPLRTHKVIGPHIRKLIENAESPTIVLPLSVTAALKAHRGNIAEAMPLLAQVYEEDPNNPDNVYAYASALADGKKYEKLTELITADDTLDAGRRSYFLLRAGENEEILHLSSNVLTPGSAAEFKNRQEVALLRINQAIALKRLDRIPEMQGIIDFLETFGYDKDNRVKIGIAALRGQKADMMAMLNEFGYEIFTARELQTFPVFEDYVAEPDFVQFIGSKEIAEKREVPGTFIPLRDTGGTNSELSDQLD